MALDDIINDALSSGGKWLKMGKVGDKIVGDIVDIDKRDKRDLEGNVVLGKKSGEPRKEWVVTIKTDEREDGDDDGVRKFSANESMQRALKEAIKRAGFTSGNQLEGAKLAIQMTREPEDRFSQADYAAQVKAGERKPVADLDDLFG